MSRPIHIAPLELAAACLLGLLAGGCADRVAAPPNAATPEPVARSAQATATGAVEESPMKADGGIAGRVTADDGRPIAEASVAAVSVDDPPLRVPEMAALTDADGRYAWPLLPGRYRLTVHAEGFAAQAREATAAARGEAPTRLDFALEAHD